jgi:hypothetical protein
LPRSRSTLSLRTKVQRTGSKVVAIKANKLKFQQDKNILVTTMTKDQIKALPQAKGT